MKVWSSLWEVLSFRWLLVISNFWDCWYNNLQITCSCEVSFYYLSFGYGLILVLCFIKSLWVIWTNLLLNFRNIGWFVYQVIVVVDSICIFQALPLHLVFFNINFNVSFFCVFMVISWDFFNLPGLFWLRFYLLWIQERMLFDSVAGEMQSSVICVHN